MTNFRNLVESVLFAINFLWSVRSSWLQNCPTNQLLSLLNTARPHIFKNCIGITTSIVSFPESFENLWKTAMLFFHLLVVTPALLSFPRQDKLLHGFEDFVHSPHLFVQEMRIMDLQEPVVSLVFIDIPVSSLNSFGKRFRWTALFL